jgi:hypothetical protein
MWLYKTVLTKLILVNLFNTVRDYTDEETPWSIPNQEAKLIMADDTLSYWDVGKVGRCGLVI